MRQSREERLALLRLVRNYRAACEAIERERDERDRYTGTDPRNTIGGHAHDPSPLCEAALKREDIQWR